MKAKLLSLALCCSFLIILGSCARQKQVWLSNLQHTHQADDKNLVRVYLDKNGYFYPDSQIYIPEIDFFDPLNNGTTIKNSPNAGSLEHYFSGYSLSTKGNYFEDKNERYLKRTEELGKHYNIPLYVTKKATFDSVQNAIVKQLGDSLRTLLLYKRSQTLVVLIHGFNDPNPTGDYQRLRTAIENQTGKEYLFLEVYWDGLTANNGTPPLEKIWGAAQKNSQEVAVGLRLLLNEIPPDTKIRVITHSLGASVGTAMLFNTLTKWKHKEAFYRYYNATFNIKAPSHKDIRLGMLAPAIPGVSTFADFDKRLWTLNEQTNNINKIVVGYNTNDSAVTKRIGKSDFITGGFGATTLGANHKDEFNKTKSRIIELGFSPAYVENLFIANDFTENDYKTKEYHGLYYYIQREMPFKRFLEEMFEE